MELFENYNALRRSLGHNDMLYRRRALFFLNLAYARMLREKAHLTQDEYETIVGGLKAVESKMTPQDMDKVEDGDIWFLVEKALSREINQDVAAKLHMGRSRNDMYFTLYRMSVRKALEKVIEATLETNCMLEKVASQNLETVIPYYTYGQPSQPGTWAHYLLGVHEALLADLKRLQAAYRTVNCSPMGSAAGIGTSFDIDKESIAKRLGFDSVIEHTGISIGAVDYFLETISACAILNTTLSRVASDMVFFASAECNILNFNFSVCESSSIMPQKKNAYAAELMRSETEHFLGYTTTAFSSAASTTFFPTHETFLFFDTFWEHIDRLVCNIGLLSLNIEQSHINKETALSRTRDGFTAATAMAEQLTKETGLPFTQTHHVVGGMIRTLMEKDALAVTNMTPELLLAQSQKHLGVAIQRSKEQIQEMLDPLHSLTCKVTGGTPKPADTQSMLEKGVACRTSVQEQFRQTKARIQSALEHLVD